MQPCAHALVAALLCGPGRLLEGAPPPQVATRAHVQELLKARILPQPAYAAPTEPLPQLGGPLPGASPAALAPTPAALAPTPAADGTDTADAPTQAAAGTGSSSDGSDTAPVVAALAAIIALLLLFTVVLAACLCWRRRAARPGKGAPPADPRGAHLGGDAPRQGGHSIGPQHAAVAGAPLLPHAGHKSSLALSYPVQYPLHVAQVLHLSRAVYQ